MRTTSRTAEPSGDQHERALALHEKAIVVDDLEMSWAIRDEWLPDVRAGGIDVLVLDLLSGVWDDLNERKLSFANACRWIEHVHERVEIIPDLVIAKNVRDIEQAKSDGNVAILIATQDMQPVLETDEFFGLNRFEGEFDWSLLRTLHRLGLRQGMACMFLSNLIGAGCMESRDAGLSDLGVSWVREMNRLGIVIDANMEVSVRTALDCAECSEDPIILSHSNSRTLHDIRRNAPDEVVKAVAGKSGVISVMPYAPEVTWNPDPGLDDLLDHVDYYANLVGPEHVGFGWDHIAGFSDAAKGHVREVGLKVWGTEQNALKNAGIERLSDTPKFTVGLVARGYSDEEILGILGGNVLRVYRSVFGS